MPTFTPTTRTKKEYNTVYIRISHRRKPDYIKTDMVVDKSRIRKGKITDTEILANCSIIIKSYYEKIKNVDISVWDVGELKKFLLEKYEDISFTDYAQKQIDKMQDEKRRTYQTYLLAVNSLKKYMAKEKILFNELTSKIIQEWIDSMSDSRRKKSLYPSCVRALLNSARKIYNDEDLNIIRIMVNPFAKVKIPKDRITEKRSIDIKLLKMFFTSEISCNVNSSGFSARKELAKDVSMMIFCLAGINVADLYYMKNTALKNKWKLCYNRKKTRDKSDNGAYTEITIPEIIRPLLKKYMGEDGMLFSFSKRFSDETTFLHNTNIGLKQICEELGWIEKKEDSRKKKTKNKPSISGNTAIGGESEKAEAKKKSYILDRPITTYTFRHSWATIAQNDCKASTELVALALCHSSAHKITETYIRKDYKPIDEINSKVIKKVFGETMISKK